MNTGHIDWSPDYKSRGGDPLRFDMKAPPDPLLGLVREARDALVAAAKGGKAAADELMTEFISKTRAANWGIINNGLIACDAALRTIMKLDAALAEAPKAEEGRSAEAGR